MNKNPFTVISPEELAAQRAEQLFVDFYEYPAVTREGNTLIIGARGCGKSMMIRCSLPDVLMLRKKKNFDELDFLAFCIPIKKTSLNLQELSSLEKQHAPYILNEHFMSLHVLMHVFLQLSKLDLCIDKFSYEKFINEFYKPKIKSVGFKGRFKVNYSTTQKFFFSLYNHICKMVDEFVIYLVKLLSQPDKSFSYNLPIISFTRFIVPLFNEIMLLSGFPRGKPIFIFFDDADNLSDVQKRILNSWLASRTQPNISIKISSQIGMYKMYLTTNNVLVESPHDYQEINISYIYTNKNADFYNKAKDILLKRLKLSNIISSVDDFFPVDEVQQRAIKKEEDKIRDSYKNSGRGYRESDDVRRYAIPNYIKHLGGSRKSRSTYKYAGIDNIIHLSSGIIRYLLDASANMYDVEFSKRKDQQVTFISPSVQNSVMRNKADTYLFIELRKSSNNDSLIEIVNNPTNLTDKLSNLINAMGKTFHDILLSDRAERKVFSIALTDVELDKEIKPVFDLGVRLGFFHESYIGNKEGNGRTRLYVLNRCFAPIFTLDPTGFQGYLFITNADLKKAIFNGKELRDIDINDKKLLIKQLSLEDFWEE